MPVDFDLPEHLIAQFPAEPRDAARLLVLRRGDGSIEHRHVRDLPALLCPGDLLVLNDSKVLPARLAGVRVATGGKWEALFLRQAEAGWELLARTRGFPRPGESLRTHSGLVLKLIDRTPERHWIVRPEDGGDATELLARHGSVPLPPYIRGGQGNLRDEERYQTVYARSPGSVAAPTAGLHFTPELLDELENRGVLRTRVTLHVGLGTFAPMKSDDPAQHIMHEEHYEVTDEAAAAIESARAAGGRIVAVGTTSARTLESATVAGRLTAGRGSTRLFIHPPHQFQQVDALLTNFHLPRTTLLLLVEALAGRELLERAYSDAIRMEYRFYSYGDAMLVL